MDKSWDKVETSKAYLDLAPEEQQAAKEEYFSTVVAKKSEFIKLSEEDKMAAQNEFMGVDTKVEEPKQNFFGAVKDLGKWAVSPLVSSEDVLSTPAGQIAAGGMPFGNSILGAVPPPFAGMIPPQYRQKMGADLISNELTPANLAINALTAGSMVAPEVGRVLGQTREAFQNPKLATQAFDEWRARLTSKASAQAAEMKGGLSQRIGEIGNESNLAVRTEKERLASNIASLNNKNSKQISIIENDLSKKIQGIKDTEQSLKGRLGRVSTQEAKQLQNESKALFQKRGQEYGDKLGKLIESSPDVPAKNVHDALEEALIDHNVLTVNQYGAVEPVRGNLSTSEQKWVSLYDNLSSSLKDNPETVVSANDLLKTEQQTKVPFGTIWGKDEHLASSVRERLGDTLAGTVQGLRELRNEYRPYFQLKRNAIKKLGIFSDTAKASEVLRRVSTPYAKKGAEERSLIGLLQKELESDIGKNTQTIQGGFKNLLQQKTEARQQADKLISGLKLDVGEEIRNIRKTSSSDIDSIKAKYDLLKQSHKDGIDANIQRLMDSKDASIQRFKTRIENLQSKYKSARFRTKVGVGAALLGTGAGRFLLRQALHSILTGG